jgi:endonuclease/exonuclease/phosphatase (EEP) superfamily protein YafD
VFDVHPLPPAIQRTAGIPVGLDTRRRDADLARIHDAVAAIEDPASALVVGDFNAGPAEPGFATVATGLRDVHAEAGVGTGFTWRPSSLEGLGLGFLRIDHVLAGDALRPVAADEDCSIAGDHCRLYATLERVAPARQR